VNARCPRCGRQLIVGIAETIAGAACPACGTVISVGKLIEADPQLSASIRQLAGLAIAVAVCIGLYQTGRGRGLDLTVRLRSQRTQPRRS
jgi:hypothetical protein